MDRQAFKLLTDTMEELRRDIKAVRQDISAVKTDLGHYKGFLGGVTFVFGILWTGFTFFFKRGQS